MILYFIGGLSMKVTNIKLTKYKTLKEKKDTIHNVPLSKVYDIVTNWMKTHPKDMEILGR